MPSVVAIPLDDTAFRGRGVEVWRIDLDASREPPEEAVAVLDEAERARLGRFLQVGDRARFAFLRAALRQRLGARLGVSARVVPIRIDARGKPRLPDDRLWFNLAHSGDHGLIAVSAAGPVGVDLEQARAHSRLDALADLILSASERALWSAERPERRHALFLRAWTAKEAVLKAAGLGLLVDPRSLTVLDDGGALTASGLARSLGFDPAGVLVRALAPVGGYVAALATLTPGAGSGSSQEMPDCHAVLAM